MVCVKEDLIGKKFNMLTVVSRGEDKIYPNSNPAAQWWCQCDCENPNLVLVRGCDLKSGHTKSCGCLHPTGFNDWEFIDEKTIKVFFKDGDGYFIMDYEDLEKVQNTSWFNHHGYVGGRVNGIQTHIHNVIMGDKYIDHKDRNPLNNCKSNLRKYDDPSLNAANTFRKIGSSGYRGVEQIILRSNKIRYRARIHRNGKHISCGRYDTPEEAARAYDAKAYELWGNLPY